MFDKIKAKMKELKKNLAAGKYTIDTQQFNDPIAEKIEWGPAKSGGTNFKTNSLIKVSSSVYRYQLSIGGKLFIGVFGLIGFIVFIVALSLLISSNPTGYFLLLFSLVFMAAAYFMYRSMGTPIVLDRTMGVIWKGKKPPKFTGDQSASSEVIYTNDVHAIQVISEWIRSDKNSYSSYEINLVLKDATRFNLVDHGNKQQILSDAQDLSEFFGKPVWDAS